MLSFILFPTLIFALQEPVDLEQHVSLARNKLPEWCNAVIFSKEATDFVAFKRPVEIHRMLSPTFKLASLCNIMVVVGLPHYPGSFSTYEDLVKRHFFQVPLVILYLNVNFANVDVEDLPGRGIWRKEVILVSQDGLTLRFGEKCDYENPVCFLRGISIKVGYTHMPPYIYVRGWVGYQEKNERYPEFRLHPRMKEEDLEIISGFEGQLIRHLVVEYLMKVTMIAPPDMLYGYHQNGEWSGKFLQLLQHQVDMIIGMITGNPDRLEVGDYLAPISTIVFTMVTKHQEHELDWKAPFLAIPYFLWASLFVSIFLVGVLAGGSHKIHLYILRDSAFTRMTWVSRILSFLRSCAKLMQILLKQPIFKNQQGPSLFILSSWMIFSLIIGSIYNSNLTAKLSVREQPQEIDTMQDVWEQRKILKVTRGTTTDLYMHTSKEHYTTLVRTNLFQYKNSTWRKHISEYYYNPNLVTMNEHQQFLYKVLTGNDGVGRKKISEYHMSEPVISIFGSWMMTKNYVLRPAMSIAMLRACEMGLIFKWRDDPLKLDDNSSVLMSKSFLKTQFDHSDGRMGNKNEPFTTKQLRGVFILLAVGLFFSFVCFVFELAMGRLTSSLPSPSIVFEYIE